MDRVSMAGLALLALLGGCGAKVEGRAMAATRLSAALPGWVGQLELAALVRARLGEPEPTWLPERRLGRGELRPPDEPEVCSDRHRVEVLERPRWVTHVVVPRETLDQIAHRYRVDPFELRAWNELPTGDVELRKGTRLRIRSQHRPPPRQRIEYSVSDGDTWWRVAVRHGVDASDLRAYNWPYRDKMAPGSVLAVWVDPIVHDWIAADPPEIPPSDDAIRRGAVGVGRPDAGWLIGGVPLPEAEGYRLRYAESAYGTTHAVRQFVAAMDAFRTSTSYRGTLAIGSMSRERGGPIGGHKSHQTGRDLDIGLPRKVGIPSWYALKPGRVDWLAAWELVVEFSETDVSAIFLDYDLQKRMYRAAKAAGASEERLATLLQYPKGSTSPGLVRHAEGHQEHVHVRFGCGPCEPECVASSGAESAP